MGDLHITHIPAGQLQPYPGNARNHPAAQVAKLAKSIKAFGFRVPILVDPYFTVVAGHGRLLAAKKLGLQTVPCLVLEDLSDEELRVFRVADNTLALESDWDWAKLCTEASELSGLGTGLIDEFLDMQKLLDGDEKLKLPEPEPVLPKDERAPKACPHCGGEL